MEKGVEKGEIASVMAPKFKIGDLVLVTICEIHKDYMIMNDPNRYLKIMFGDYMKLPPEEDRIPQHLGKKIIFDTASESV